MVKRFTIQPEPSTQTETKHPKREELDYHKPFQNKEMKNMSSSSVKYWLLGGLCVGLALGLFTKRM